MTNINAKDQMQRAYELLLKEHILLVDEEHVEYREDTIFSKRYCDYFLQPETTQNEIYNALANGPEREIVLICDFQMGRLSPRFGQSLQPRRTHY